MTPTLLDEIKILAQSYPPPSDIKMAKRLMRLERMKSFYIEKAPEAPEKQAQMFNAFSSSLLYAIVTIKSYRKLTQRLSTLSGENKND